MEEQFWHSRWETGRIGFHEGAPNALLVKHIDALSTDQAAHVFVPLCGKASDLDWLLARGHRVTGIEFNRGAIETVFERLSLTPEIDEVAGLTRFVGRHLTLWHGDFFQLGQDVLGAVDAVYDRAALVALPDELRPYYARHLLEVTDRAPQLLISYDYDQSQMGGPPFSVPGHMIEQYYGDRFEIELLADDAITGPLADRCSGQEQAWRLSAKHA